MVNVFNAMNRGFNERLDQRNRQRREIANAFNEFRRANPEATLADFQSFIDAQAGSGLGSNYLRGGAPSKEILTKIAEENALRKKYRVAQEERDRIVAQGEFSGYLQGEMDKALLKANAAELDTAKNKWLKTLSPEGQRLASEMAILDGWTEKRYNYLQGQRLRQSLPDLQNYLKLNQYSLDKVNADDLSAAFGIDKSQIEPFIQAAEREARMYMQDWWETHNSKIMNEALEAARAGLDEDAIKNRISGILQSSPQADNFKLGEYDKMIDAAVAQAKKVQEQELATRTTASKQMVGQLEEEFDKDKNLVEAIRDGRNEDALAMMLRMAKNRLKEDDWILGYGIEGGSKAVPDDFFKDQLSKIVESARTAQNDYFNKRSEEFDNDVAKISDNFRAVNVQNMQGVFEGMFGKETGAKLATALAYDYAMSPALAQTVMAAMSSLPQDVKDAAEKDDNYMAAVEHIKSELEAAGFTPNLNEARKAHIQNKKEASAIYQPMKFDDWLNQENDDFLADRDAYGNRINEMRRAYQDNPEILADQLLKLQRAIQQTFNARVDEMEMRKKRAYGSTGWILHNSGGWDDARVDNLLKSAKEATDAQVKSIQFMIENAQRDLAEKKAAEAEANKPAEGNENVDAPREEKTVIGGALGDWSSNALANDQIRAAAGFATDGTWLGMPQAIVNAPIGAITNAFSTEAEYNRRQGMKQYVEGAQDILNEYGALLLQNNMNAQFQTMLKDIETLTAEEFGQKYDAALKELLNKRTFTPVQ